MESQSLYTDPTPAAPAQPAERASVFEDFLDIFYAPSQVFERRRDGQFGLALFILVLIMVALYFAFRGVMEPLYDTMVDAQIAAAVKQNPEIPAAQMEGMRGMMSKTIPLYGILGAPIIILLSGVALWLVGKLFDAKQTLPQAFMVATYANVPRFVLGSLVVALQAFALGSDAGTGIFSYSLGAARFAPDAALPMQNLLNRVELFTIWAAVLTGIGLSITGRIPRRQAFMAAAIVWLLGTLLTGAQLAAGG